MSAADTDIHDIRAPFLIPPDWRVPALIAAGVLLLAVLLLWGWRWYRARRPPLTLLAANPAAPGGRRAL